MYCVSLLVLSFHSANSSVHCNSYIREVHRWISLCLRDHSFPPSFVVCWQCVRWFWTTNCENAEGSDRDLFSGTATVPVKTYRLLACDTNISEETFDSIFWTENSEYWKRVFFETMCTYQIIRRHILGYCVNIDRRVNSTHPSLCFNVLRRIMGNLNLG
jgi:hypothetical protein